MNRIHNTLYKTNNRPKTVVLSGIMNKLPSDWQWMRLGEIMNLVNGKIISKSDMSEFGLYPVYGSNGIFNRTDKYLIERDSIVIGRVGASCGTVHIARAPAWISDNAMYIERISDVIDNKYLFYALSWRNLSLLAKISAQPSISQGPISDQFIPLPPIIDQKQIVSRIEAIKSRVELVRIHRNNLLNDIRELIEIILHQIFKKAQENDWEWQKLVDIASINNDNRNPTKVTPDEPFRYVDISNVDGDSGLITSHKVILGKNAPLRARRVMHTNDIIMSTVRPYLKSFALVPSEYDQQICSTGFAVLSSFETIQPEFLWYVLRSPTVISQCKALTVGAHYPVLKIAQLSEMTIPVPPIYEQRVIINYLNEFTKKIHCLRQLQQMRDLEFDTITISVLNLAFKGEL